MKFIFSHKSISQVVVTALRLTWCWRAAHSISSFLVSPVEDTAIAERDGSSEAVCICSRADRPSGETEARAGHAQLSGGKAAADTGG